MIDKEWISLVLCVCFNVFNNKESYFTATFELLFPQNAENWYF